MSPDNSAIRDAVRNRQLPSALILSDREILAAGNLVHIRAKDSFRGGDSVNVIISASRMTKDKLWSQVHLGVHGDRFAGLDFHPNKEQPGRFIDMGFVHATDSLTDALEVANSYIERQLNEGFVPGDGLPVLLTRALFVEAFRKHPRRT